MDSQSRRSLLTVLFGFVIGGTRMSSRQPEVSRLAASATPRRRWLREPLLHFLVAGVAVFVVYHALNPASAAREPSNQIKLTDDDLRQMAEAWIAQGRSPPSPEQMASLVAMRIREEILFREALALGLDKNDTIVKRRLAQKMEFLADDLSEIADPAPDELKAWFEANAERLAFAPRVSFRHLYFSPDRRGASASEQAARSLEKLRREPPDSRSAAKLADRFMFQDYYGDHSRDQIASVFGVAFAQSLLALEPGSWQGPIESGYGWHLVWIDTLVPKRVPAFEEVEAEIKREWIAERRAESKRNVYESMRARYELIVPESLARQTRTEPEKRP
jgi:peptidyl-prolyl cis-trans isomerase C